MVWVTVSAEILPGYDSEAAVCARLASLPLHRIEGLWRFPGSGGTVAIEREGRAEAQTYVMVAVVPQNRAVRPGTVMGHLTAAAKKGAYDAKLFTKESKSDGTLSKPKRFEIELQDGDNRMVIKPYGKKWDVRWWNLFPYMYRRVIYRVGSEPDDLKGCVRQFPEPIPPIEPRYL